MQYYQDRFVQREVGDLDVVCPSSIHGCSWEGKLNQYDQHVSQECTFRPTPPAHDFYILHFFTAAPSLPTQYTTMQREFCDLCCESVRSCELETHKENCMFLHQAKQCPFFPLSCHNDSYMDISELEEHMKDYH